MSTAPRLHVVSEKEKALHELTEMVSTVETCYFRPRDSIAHKEKDIVTVPPMRPIRLLAIEKRVGWIDSPHKHSIFDGFVERYENNQNYYLSRLQADSLSKEDVRKALTALECWFAQLIEPHPRLPPKRAKAPKRKLFLQELEEWRIREKEKLKRGRSYYCEDEVVSLLDWDTLQTIQKSLSKNYQTVETFYELLRREYAL